MAINAVMTFWFSLLARRGAFDGLQSIIELGPQDMQTTRAVVEQIARRHAADRVEETLAAFYPDGGDAFAPDGQQTLYALFGLSPYQSIDVADARATYTYDLNEPVSRGQLQCDVVTNFGTAEHCFNIAAVFETVHNLLAPGGLALHVLPAFGDLDHGFYNINPMLYGRLARANGYQIADVRYVDHLFLKCLQVEAAPEHGFDFDRLEIGFADMQSRQVFARKAAVQFLTNMASQETAEKILPVIGEVPAIVFDYAFVALRKTTDAPFVLPLQGGNEDRNWYAENMTSPAAA